jgi:hypothetical protein
MATPTVAQQQAIANLYIALFNRAPDADGFNFWTQALANGASLDTIARNFVTTPESRAVYPESQTAEQFVSAYYSNVLGRPIDANGLAFWTKLLQDSGGVNSAGARANVVNQIVDIVNTPLPVKPADITAEAYALTFADRNAFHNKGVVAVYFAVDYKGTDLNLAKQVLTVVGPTTTTIDVAKALLNPPAGGSTPPVPSTPVDLPGTVGLDRLLGGTADDKFSFVIDKNAAINTTLTAGDAVTGGAGNDTLTVATVGAVVNGDFTLADITGIETVIFQRASGSSITLDVWDSVKTLVVDGGNGTVSANTLANGANVFIKGTTGGSVNPFYVAAATQSEMTLDGVSATDVQFSAAGLTSLKLTSTGASSTLTSLLTSPKLASIEIVADAALSIGYFQGASNPAGTNVSISGTAGVTLTGLSDASIKSVDASANTGGLTATLHTNNPIIAIKGSAANDNISIGSAVLSSGSVDAGSGSADRLIVSASNTLATPALGAKYTNFEILKIQNGVTVDVSSINGITSVEIEDGAGTTGATNLNATQAAAVSILSAGATGLITIGVAGAADVAQVDTVKAALTTSGSQAINLTGLTLANIEKLELTGNGATAVTTGLVTFDTVNATALDSIIVKNAGGATIVVDGTHVAANLSIDASQSTGLVTINASAYSPATGAVIKGGSTGSTLTGSANADTIIGGAGADTLIGGAGNDYLLGDGTLNGVNTAEVQTMRLSGTATNSGTYTLGNTSVVVTAGDSSSVVVSAFAGAGKTAFLAQNSNVQDITYSGDEFTITYKAALGDVPLISVNDPADISFNTMFPVVESIQGRFGLAAATSATADTLTGGAGNDTFAFAQNSSVLTAIDTITDLNLGTGAVGGRVDSLVFHNVSGAASVVSVAAQQAAITAAGSLAAAVDLVLGVAVGDGATAQFTYGADTYIVHNGDGNTTFDNAADFLIKVTGVLGTLDVSDIVLVSGVLPP